MPRRPTPTPRDAADQFCTTARALRSAHDLLIAICEADWPGVNGIADDADTIGIDGPAVFKALQAFALRIDPTVAQRFPELQEDVRP